MPLLAVPSVTAHPSTASVPITVLLYNGSLLCGFNVPIKGLTRIMRLRLCELGRMVTLPFNHLTFNLKMASRVVQN